MLFVFFPKGPSQCFLVGYVGWETTFFSGSELLSRAFAIGSREFFFFNFSQNFILGMKISGGFWRGTWDDGCPFT